MSILDHFPTPPLPGPRQGQIAVLQEVEKALEAGYTTILIEAPVGSGKSGIAMALARWAKSAHILTPLKALQDQYFFDFSMYSVMMKGRSSYPCTFSASPEAAAQIKTSISEGRRVAVGQGSLHCGNGPCRDSPSTYVACTNLTESGVEQNPCPYTLAIQAAQQHSIIIHNLHSYIYQTHFGGKFTPRKMMIIDEGHRIESILRDFVKFKITLPFLFEDNGDSPPWENFEDIGQWIEFFTEERFLPKDEENRKKYMERILKVEESMSSNSAMWNRFAVNVEPQHYNNTTRFELTPERLGNLPNMLLYNGGEINVIMSGTIYDKAMFCRDRGIDADKAYMIRIGSTFPLESRPIIMKPEYMVNTSHAEWSANLPEMADKIRKILKVFGDVKGVIHVPSYRAALEIAGAVGDPRLITHTAEETRDSLEAFFHSSGNAVFVSPVCYEGVDFKFDRARFQIILRIPYLNAGDEFVSMKMKTDFAWYNYQALITFGQQVGRVNRSEKDFGVTILMDSRFPKFIQKNRGKLPKWLTQAIVQK